MCKISKYYKSIMLKTVKFTLIAPLAHFLLYFKQEKCIFPLQQRKEIIIFIAHLP